MQRVLAVPMSVVVLLASCGPTPTDTTTPADERGLQAVTAVAPSVNAVVQWNRILLQIVRTPGAQPATVHPTRSFAILHAAIYDAVNSIDRTYTPYVVRLQGAAGGAPRSASQEAAAAAAAHDVLVALYPSLRAQLDTQQQHSLAQVPEGEHKTAGVRIGQTVAASILSRRSNDRSDAQPISYVFGTAPGDYQSTPPNFPPQPQFTHWSRVTPFALERANQFRPGPPPVLTSDAYGDSSTRSSHSAWRTVRSRPRTRR